MASAAQIPTDDALRELAACEADILTLVRTVEQTLEELQRLPQCNPDKIDQLSATFLTKLQGVQEQLKKHSHVLSVKKEATATGNSAFLNQQKAEVALALKELER